MPKITPQSITARLEGISRYERAQRSGSITEGEDQG